MKQKSNPEAGAEASTEASAEAGAEASAEAERRKALIQAQLALIPNGKMTAAIQSWQTFAAHLMSIIGEEGFLVLYARSLHLLRADFPQLPHAAPEPSATCWLADLEIALSGQDLIEAQTANLQLLMTFTNILASLIGEGLTIEIMRSAWSVSTTDKPPASKESDDDQ